MKVLPLVVIILLVFISNQINCYWISLPAAVKLNQVIRSIFNSRKINAGDTGPAAVADDDDEKKLRQFSFSKNVYVNKTTSQSILTVTLISTTVVSTSQFCAHFVNNVFGGCRRRRELLNGNEDVIALNLQPSKIDRYVITLLYIFW